MTGQQIGTVVGYFVGGMYGYPQLGAMVGGYAGGVISPTVIKGPSIGDAQSQTSMGGMPIPKFHGHCSPVAPTLIDGDKIARKVTRESGGKGSTTVQETEGFIATRFFLVGEGDGVATIARIRRNGKLVYSAIEGDNIDADSAAFRNQITIWQGGPSQGPSPALEAIHGVGNVNYYRKRLCFEVRDDDETQTGGAANQYRVEVIASGESSTVCSEVPWIHGFTGSTQSIFDVAINRATGITCGWNDNLRRTQDGGRSWQGIDYITPTGWDPAEPIIAVWYDADPSAPAWYIAKADAVAVSYDDGLLFTNYVTPVHLIHGIIGNGGSVFAAAGAFWAGAYNQVNTTIFQPLVLGDTDVDLGADYGEVTAIGDVLGNIIVGTQQGNIITADLELRYTDASTRPIVQFAHGNNVTLAALGSGGYVRSTDAGINWTFHASAGDSPSIIFALGGFWRVTRQYVEHSTDGITWSEVDDYFFGAAQGEFIRTDNRGSILATSQVGLTSSLPTSNMLPDIAGAFITDTGEITGICVDRIVGDAAVWSDIALDIAERAHTLLPPQMNVAHMTDLVPGFTLGNTSLTGADYMRTLCMFGAEKVTDLIERDDELYANRRGGAVVATFDPDDLLSIEEEDDDIRRQAITGFKRLTVMYPDPANNYVPTPQTAPRTSPDVTASNNVTMECPIPFDHDTMSQKADIMQKIAFMELEGSLKRNFRAQYSQWVCGDPIVFGDRRYMIRKASNDDSMVRFEYTYDRPSAYTSLASGSNASAPAPQSSNIKGPTKFSALNSPSLRTQDNVPGMYIAVCGILDGWAGCDVQMSIDGGETYQTVMTIRNESTMGYLVEATDEDGNDSSGLITVFVYHNHVLSSVSDAQITAGANAFAMVTGSTTEIAQFQTATETSNGDFDLTNVTRGELETIAAPHFVRDQFVLLDATTVSNFLPIDASLAGQVLLFRPVTLGTAAANNEVYPVLFAPIFTSTTVDYRITESGDVRVTESGDYRLVD